MMLVSIANRPLIYLITAGDATDDNFSEMIVSISRQVNEAVDESVSIVQIREKQLSAKHLFELASVCIETTRASPTKLLINDRADIAAAAGADGVHLTSSSVPAAMVRGAFGRHFIIGVSTHSPDEVIAASRGGADFVVFGPVFDTPGKGPAVGVDELKRVCADVAPFPVLALGGIDAANCGDVLRAGAAGIAGIRSFGNRESLRTLRATISHVSTK